MKRVLLFLSVCLGLSVAGFTQAQSAPDILITQNTNFSTLDETIQPIEEYLDVGVTARGATGLRDFIINTFYDVVFPLVFAVGLLMAILGIIGLLFSDDEADRAKTLKIVMWGVIGIVLIVSARYITYTVLGEGGDGGLLFWQSGQVSGVYVAQDLYDRLIMPFVRIGMMLIVGVLFIMLLIRVMGFLFSPSDDVRKQSLAIIGRNALGILVIIGARYVVELIYGTKESILQGADTYQLSSIGQSIFGEASAGAISLFYAIINRVIGLTSLVILIIIIRQAYQLLTNPEDESKLARVGKSLMYIFIGIVIIGLAYVITNVILIQ